jgi:nitrite reductase/ring-hydroxylating ferredoxin subunit
MSDDCGGCRLSRREFVKDVLVLSAGALAAQGLAPMKLLAVPVSILSPAQRRLQLLTYPIPAQDGASIDRDNQVILVRYQSHLFAFALSCPHQNTALRWLEEEGRFQCPKHHSKYQPDGVFISGRATRGMDRYEVHREGESVVVNLEQLYHDDVDHAGWLSAAVQL